MEDFFLVVFVSVMVVVIIYILILDFQAEAEKLRKKERKKEKKRREKEEDALWEREEERKRAEYMASPQYEWDITHQPGGDCPMCGNSMMVVKKELPFEDECEQCKHTFTFVYKKIRNVKEESYQVANPSYESQMRGWDKRNAKKSWLEDIDYSSVPLTHKTKTRKKAYYTDGIKATRPKPPRASSKSSGREPIPQDLMDAVWNRDGGQCVKCSSNQDLEYDHMIPLSKGGSNKYRNLQLLCLKCNRSKSDKIG